MFSIRIVVRLWFLEMARISRVLPKLENNYRNFLFIPQYQNIHQAELYIRKKVVRVACNIIVDLPFFMLSTPIFLTIWRAPHLYTKLHKVFFIFSQLERFHQIIEELFVFKNLENG